MKSWRKKENTPLDELLHDNAIEIIRRFLICIYDKAKNPLDSIITLTLITYVIAPELLQQADLGSIAKMFDVTKACLTDRLHKINEDFGIRGRMQKTDGACKNYSKAKKQYHKRRKAKQ